MAVLWLAAACHYYQTEYLVKCLRDFKAVGMNTALTYLSRLCLCDPQV